MDDLAKWEILSQYDTADFDEAVNKIPYKADKLSGFLDFTFPIDKPQYFFKNLYYGRDCDDFARIWTCYYKKKGIAVNEWIVTSKKHPIRHMHMIATALEADGWRVLNYHRSTKAYDNEQKGIAEVISHTMGYSDVIMKKYREWR